MIILVAGRRELGKTTKAWHLASQKEFPKRIVFDPRGMFDADDPIYDLPGESAEFLARCYDPEVRTIVVQPQNDLETSCHALADLCRQYISDRTPKLSILIDEAGLLKDGNVSWLKYWDWVFRCAKRPDVYVIITAHRPVDFPTNVRALADYWIIFRTTLNRDLEPIKDHCGDEFADACVELQPREFLMWNDAKGEAYVTTDPGSWYVPLDPNVNALPPTTGAALPAPVQQQKGLFDA